MTGDILRPVDIAQVDQQWLRHDWHRFCTPDDARRMGLVHPDTRQAERRRAWEAEAQGARADAQFKADQAEILTEIATLVSYSGGFTYTRDMMALNKWIANMSTPVTRRACLAQAAAREAIR